MGFVVQFVVTFSKNGENEYAPAGKGAPGTSVAAGRGRGGGSDSFLSRTHVSHLPHLKQQARRRSDLPLLPLSQSYDQTDHESHNDQQHQHREQQQPPPPASPGYELAIPDLVQLLASRAEDTCIYAIWWRWVLIAVLRWVTQVDPFCEGTIGEPGRGRRWNGGISILQDHGKTIGLCAGGRWRVTWRAEQGLRGAHD